MKAIKITISTIRSFNALIPILKRSVNEYGIIGFGCKIDDNAESLISTLIQSGGIKGENISVNNVANAILNDNWTTD